MDGQVPIITKKYLELIVTSMLKKLESHIVSSPPSTSSIEPLETMITIPPTSWDVKWVLKDTKLGFLYRRKN